MNTYTDEMKETVRSIKGEWRCEIDTGTKKEQFNLRINDEKCVLIRAVAGVEVEKVEFSGNAHWFGPWLCFLDSPKQYYARFADSKFLDFGEYAGNIIGSFLWQYRFQRI